METRRSIFVPFNADLDIWHCICFELDYLKESCLTDTRSLNLIDSGLNWHTYYYQAN